MKCRKECCRLQIASPLFDFVDNELLPGTAMDRTHIWQTLARLVDEIAPRNRELLAKRNTLQTLIDDWHASRRGSAIDPLHYRRFLEEIGYILPEPTDVWVATEGVDDEIATIAGPQLVVPVINARFALNATNARWGSLFNALYGSDVIDGPIDHTRDDYDPVRGAKVIDYSCGFLDKSVPLRGARYAEVARFELSDASPVTLDVVLANGQWTTLAQPTQFIGFARKAKRTSILLQHNGLHIDLQIDPHHTVGAAAPGNVCDIIVESALTTIQDCEDSVAAVDATDKAAVYRNWLGLMRGDLESTFVKNGKSMTRRLGGDRRYRTPRGDELTLPGRSLLMSRNVGPHMMTDIVLDPAGSLIPEGLLDAVMTTACAIHDLQKHGTNGNSRSGSVYIVKPKLHGPEEAAMVNDMFDIVEDGLGLKRNTIKIGIMDEERRTSVNLKACVAATRSRIVFINTGFLDRTGDEIHTSMFAGAFLPKDSLKNQKWIIAYENQNVEVGLECGFRGRAQIGKGMWPKPDAMKEMVEMKVAHPRSGASTAWVPSPTAATLHAMHYHAVDVPQRQIEIAKRSRASLDEILTLPLLSQSHTIGESAIQAELNNNIQGILGYVVRWIEQGIGCSKVLDIFNVALMEDRATLRISSQHVANWLCHGICNERQVLETIRRMAGIVDHQNEGDSQYRKMGPHIEESRAYRATVELIFRGEVEPNGYTENVLHSWRREAKAALNGA